MASELILITGPVLSGKTWLANLLKISLKDLIIYDEPVLDRKTLKEIKLYQNCNGRVVITTCDANPVLKVLRPDKVITMSAP